MCRVGNIDVWRYTGLLIVVADHGEASSRDGIADVGRRSGSHVREYGKDRNVPKDSTLIGLQVQIWEHLTLVWRHMAPFSISHDITYHISQFRITPKNLYTTARACISSNYFIQLAAQVKIYIKQIIINHLFTQSSVILSCSSGMGTKLSRLIDRELNSGSQCGGTNCRIKSGRTDSSEYPVLTYNRQRRTSPLLTLTCEIEKQWKVFPIGHPGAFNPQLVEEWMNHRFNRAQPCTWRVFQQLRHQIYCFRSRTRAENLSHHHCE